jgi:hypothetical protein
MLASSDEVRWKVFCVQWLHRLQGMQAGRMTARNGGGCIHTCSTACGHKLGAVFCLFTRLTKDGTTVQRSWYAGY